MFTRATPIAILCFVLAGGDAWGQGYVGVYGDAAGTVRCIPAPPFVPKTLYVLAKPSGVSVGGIAGVEFRVAIEAPSGYIFSYSPADSAQVLGDPLGSTGANIAWPTCQVPDAEGNVSLGTIHLVNLGTGGPTDIVVTRRDPPTNSQRVCPVLVLCDAPTYTTHCTVAPTDSVSCLNK